MGKKSFAEEIQVTPKGIGKIQFRKIYIYFAKIENKNTSVRK